jgi:DNA-directed RNA polymerase subunit H (RpoH/RPB5)
MSLNPELIPVKKDRETIRKHVLTNIVKMLNERGLIDEKNIQKSLEDIKKGKDDDIYKINLTKNIKADGEDKEYIKKFDGSSVIIKIIHQKVQGIAKMPVIKDFITQYPNNHKIFVFDSISDKARSNLMDMQNIEVFNESFLMINLVDHIDSPKYELLTEDEGKEVLDSYILKKKEMMRILTTDPVVTYFNLKRGDIIRVIRCSEQSGKNIAYRIVAKGST